MCGRYTLTNPRDLAARFGLEAIAETRLPSLMRTDEALEFAT